MLHTAPGFYQGGADDQFQQAPVYYVAQPAFYGPPGWAPGAPAPQAVSDEVRTVFITGFPDDVRERELNNMLRFLPGYEASQMHFRNGQAQGFALFVSGQLARQAVDAIQNLVFDADCVLRAEMAHKNMYLKDDPSLAPKRSRPSYEGGSYAAYPPAVAPGPPGAPYGAPPGAYAVAPGPGGPVGVGLPGGVAPGVVGVGGAAGGVGVPPGAVVAPVQPRGYAPITNTKDNPPCNTLFIGNLGDGVSEAEIRGLFSHQPGFQQLKLVRGPKGVTCFIEFADIPSAMAVHDAQQGAILASSDRGGIRIQYSKNPFGRKRDAAGAFVDPAAAAGAAAAAAAAAAQNGGHAVAPGGAGGQPGAPPRSAAEAQQLALADAAAAAYAAQQAGQQGGGGS